jgi:outer membrane protein OmpA-like peptidoglycan-associated protein
MTTTRNAPDARTRFGISLRACMIGLALILGVAACTSPRTRAPSAAPHAAKPASHMPGTVVLGPRNYEQDKSRIKQALAHANDSLAPAEVGYYMDVLQARLAQLADKRLAVTRKDERIVLALSLRFEAGSTRLEPDSREILTPLSSVLVEYHMTLVTVHIGADGDAVAGSPAVTQQRAQAVAQYFVKTGVHRKRIVIAGSGVNQPPVASLENRTRVELQVEPLVHSVSAAP